MGSAKTNPRVGTLPCGQLVGRGLFSRTFWRGLNAHTPNAAPRAGAHTALWFICNNHL